MSLHGGAHARVAAQVVVTLDQSQPHTHGRLLQRIWQLLTLRVRTLSAVRSSPARHARDLRCHAAVDSMELKVNTCRAVMFNSSARRESGVISLLGS